MVWALLLLSLTPGIAASQFREHWEEQVPPTARIVAYVLSGVLIAVACGLIITAPDESRSSRPPEGT